MADIVHSSSRDILIRKIGYSAGLENTRSRLLPLVDLYSAEHQITNTSWTKTVTEQYRRDAKSKVHFENFFKIIGVLRKEQGRLVALPTLEALTILKALLSEDQNQFETAVDPILLFALTMADGELLANLMMTRFVSKEFESQLTTFRETKLRYFYEAYKNENDRRKLHRCIDFKEMPKSGTRGKEKKGPFADVRELENEDPYDFQVRLSDDWFRKVPGRRESWARDLGLWSDSGITLRGKAYLEMLSGFLPESISDTKAAILMPTDLEFSANFLTWALGLEDLVSFDDLTTGIGKLFAVDPSQELALSEAELEDLVRNAKDIYSASDIRFARIRKELPLTIFALVLLGLSVVRGYACPSLQRIVSQFQASNTNVLVRKSRNSLYSFSMSSK